MINKICCQINFCSSFIYSVFEVCWKATIC